MVEAIDVPDGWSVATVEELAEAKGIAYGVLKPGPPTPDGVPMLRVTDVKDGRIDPSSLYMISHELDAEFRRTKLRGGEVVISIQGSVGRVAVVPPELSGANVSRTLAVVRLKTSAMAPWLHRALEAPRAQEAMRRVVGGTTRDSLNLRDLRVLEIPIAPEPDRSKILKALSSALSLNESSALNIAAASATIQIFRQAVLASACAGRLTADWRDMRPNLPIHVDPPSTRPRQFQALDQYELEALPDSWRWQQVDDLVPPGGVFDGPFGSNLKSADYKEHGARVVRLENIGHLRFIGDKQTYVSSEKFELLEKHAVWPNDILFSSFVDRTIRVCLLPSGLGRTLAKADCFTIRPKEFVNRKYLAMQLASMRSFALLASQIHGATRPRVNTTQLRSLPIPLCSFEEQSEIVRLVEEQFELADQLTVRFRSAARIVDRSKQALLAKAFRGELWSLAASG